MTTTPGTEASTATRAAAPAPAPFPLATGRTKGYERRAVDDFLARARSAFEADSFDAGGGPALTAADVRSVAFPLARRGYLIAAVDAALSRIEDAFAAQEREQALEVAGAREWVGRTRETAQVVLDRLARRRGRRFQRVSALRYGYRIDEVDLVTDKLARYLETGDSVTVEQVRAVAFRMQRGGYREVQVDAVLDAVVEVMLAVA
ncbi:DivIVA domain-containing protein [uncultured Microbacterium sp.]|uniref:DivIVA domain-containing protein n=1 Tax=uncultured Microbacterium sp. TaxID=191216 RepID=UPI0035CC978E